MGQQQLLLIILGVIIVGIAVAVGITMFQDNAISANKDAVVNDLVQLAAKAQQHYRKPTSLGGGGNSYAGIDSAGSLVSAAFHHNDNGIYRVTTTGTTSIVITGYGRSQNADGTYPQIAMTVNPTGNVLGQWFATLTTLSGL
jgi:Tfp pilus assembly protein PilE